MRVSLVIVSRDRERDLCRLLSSLRFLTFRDFEAIVVSDRNPHGFAPDIPGIERLRFVPFDERNIAAARNAGIRFSGGEIVAFCDDDAVPEPTWLGHLVAPFADPAVGAAGGYVRGRNGISFQWRAGTFDRYGNTTPLALSTDDAVILSGDRVTGIKTEGTNCAFRRSALIQAGGFDERFRYFLDETDLDYRLGVLGWKTAIVPRAEVHHGFAANGSRNHLRAPTSLGDIGASKAWFCAKHGEKTEADAEIAAFRRAERLRLVQAMVEGLIEPRDVERLLATLDRGLAEGRDAPALPPALRPSDRPGGFEPFPDSPQAPPLVAVASRWSLWPRTLRRILDLVAEGQNVTAFRLSPTSRFHRMRFDRRGFWLQSGGVFGKSERDQPLTRLTRFHRRVRQEMDRLARVRPLALLASRR